MAASTQPDDPLMRETLYRMYRSFFSKAEKKRRWSLEDDIPWKDVNRNMDPAIADVVESFCAVELYLPDYVAKALPMVRTNRGWAWFHANWGYEEAKHSLALSDWLLHSGSRTEGQLTDLEAQVFSHEWNLPQDSPQGMVIYAMVQELSTFLHYRNLKHHADAHGDPALSKLLQLITIDERAHHAFYKSLVKVFLEADRETTLEQLKRVLSSFAMPAVHMLADSQQRMARVKALGIFDEDIFYREVYLPILEDLGIDRREMRRPLSSRKSA